ncbi:uncharacterized protein LOC133205959 [Saccostrea echinata]|uniref:uncharacterized protein LOC133205959 n=1 Tax=Saccostrea echinata TaxID=191078 RepID=UPI002A80982E|nr:uncharacterized protein LOC133205959 [Saccostrea echinata]
MAFNKGNYVFFLVVMLISFSKGQDQVTDNSLIPNMPSFPGDPPPAGDPFDVPLVATNTNEQVSLGALGDTPTIDSVADPVSQPIASDVPDVVTNEPITMTENVETLTDLPPVDRGTRLNPRTGEIVTDPPDVTDTNLISGPDVISVGDGSIPSNLAVDPTVPVTTVDSNFDLNGTFDGRNDMLLLTGTKPTNDTLIVGSEIPPSVENIGNISLAEIATGLSTQVPDVTDTVSDVIDTETELKTSVGGEVTQNAIGLDNMNTIDSISTNINVQNPEISISTTMGDQTSVDQGIPSDLLNTPNVTDFPNLPEATDRIVETPLIATSTETSKSTVDLRSEYERITEEYESFLEENPNTTFPAPSAPPPRKEFPSALPPIENTPVIPPAPIPPVPSSSQDLQPIVTQEMVSTVPSAIEDTRFVVPREPVPPALPPREDSLPGQTPPSEIETSFTTQPIVLTTRPTTSGMEISVQPDISVAGTDTLTEARSIQVSSTMSPEASTRRALITRNRMRGIPDLPIPPPPPSDVFKTDFGENINQKSKSFKYEPVIPERDVTGRSDVIGIQTISDRNTPKNNAYPFVIDQQRNRPRETGTRQRDRGMSLIQYQFNNRNTQRAGRRSGERDNRTGNRATNQRQNQNSYSLQALFDKDKKFIARFDQPGMPFYQGTSGRQPDNAFFYSQPSNSKPFYEVQDSANTRVFSDSKDTMPPIVVREYDPRSSRQKTETRIQSTSRPVAARFNPRNVRDPQASRTNAPSFKNRRDNSYEMWYQIMGDEWEKNPNRYRQPEVNSSPNRRDMGGRVLNTFWSGSSFDGRSGRMRTENNKRISSINKPSRKEGGNPTAGSQISNRRDNSLPFDPQIQRSRSSNSMSTKQSQRPNQKANSFVFEPQLQRFQSSGPHRMKIKEYTITRDPNIVSTTEARLNLRVPTLSRPLEPEERSNSLFSQNNPPPINIGNDISELEFQTFITTTERPTTLPQPSVVSGFRNRQRSVATTGTRNKNLSRNRASNDNLLPPPPIISRQRKFNPPIESVSPMNPLDNQVNEFRTATIVPSIQSERDIPLVKSIPNAVPYVPEMQTQRKRDRRLSALPRPPAIVVGSSSGGDLTGAGNDQNPPSIRNAQPLQQSTPYSFTQVPELTPVPPLFSVNRTLVMKLQNDSVTKEELHPSVCHQCHYVSDVCYLSEAGICNRFVECHKNGDQVRAFEKECAIGNFWNPETLACQKSLYVNCPSDPCKNPAVKTHPFLGRCRYFWKCNRGMSEFELCSPNYRYDGVTETCVPDLTCKDNDLPNELAPQQEKKPEKCIWTAVDGTLTSFTDGFRQQKCAPGTRFDEVQCTCVISNLKPEGEVCNPDTLIDFEGGEPAAFTDKSGHMNGIGKNGVILKDGTGFFFGRGKLSFWRYANVELGPLLAIQIRFFPYGHAKNPMGLVSNCNGSPIGSTVDIRLDTRTQKAAFKLSTNQQLNNVITLPYEPFKWNTATYVYAGDTFTASINDKKETIPVEGSIPNRHPAIQVGGCNREDGFRGYADDIKIYNGCIPEEFEYIIFT